jgi:hypothetical protein
VVVTACAQVLLELSDVELEVGLGITHPMHRKKLRLAIEEHRHPALVRYPCIAQLGHTWVSSEWLPDLGLAQASAMIHIIFTYYYNITAQRSNRSSKDFIFLYAFTSHYSIY